MALKQVGAVNVASGKICPCVQIVRTNGGPYATPDEGKAHKLAFFYR